MTHNQDQHNIVEGGGQPQQQQHLQSPASAAAAASWAMAYNAAAAAAISPYDTGGAGAGAVYHHHHHHHPAAVAAAGHQQGQNILGISTSELLIKLHNNPILQAFASKLIVVRFLYSPIQNRIYKVPSHIFCLPVEYVQ